MPNCLSWTGRTFAAFLPAETRGCHKRQLRRETGPEFLLPPRWSLLPRRPTATVPQKGGFAAGGASPQKAHGARDRRRSFLLARLRRTFSSISSIVTGLARECRSCFFCSPGEAGRICLTTTSSEIHNPGPR